jgi:hypothetical protein
MRAFEHFHQQNYPVFHVFAPKRVGSFICAGDPRINGIFAIFQPYRQFRSREPRFGACDA